MLSDGLCVVPVRVCFDHLNVLASINDLALIIDRLGNYEEAEAVYRECSRKGL